MHRNLYQQAMRTHGQHLAVLVEEQQKEKFVFVEGKAEEHLDEKAANFDQHESTPNNPEPVPPIPRQQSGVRLTGTLRDLVQPHIISMDSSTEGSSKSDTSPEILPLGVPRELHEPFDESNNISWQKETTGQKCEIEPQTQCSDSFTNRLHNFIAKKAGILFTASATAQKPSLSPSIQEMEDLDYYAILPPLEQFMDVPPDSSRKRLFEILRVDDVIAGSIIAIKEFGMFVRVLCLCGKSSRYIQNSDVVGLLPKGELGDRFSQVAQLEDFRVRDIVRCLVVKADAANEKVILTMKNAAGVNEDYPLGIINESDLSVYCRRSQTQLETGESYDEMLDNTLGFDNPHNVAYLASIVQVDDKDPPSLMPGLQSSNFSPEEHAEALRKWQSHKWSMESVARGVEHFKASRHLEAMQQLTRALEIDPENVEGLVARGALFANQDNLSKAIKDFAEALRVKPAHKNANKYMCETLLEKGKQCEESGDKEKAIDCYQSAVDLNPESHDAKLSLQKLTKASRRSVPNGGDEEDVVSVSDDSPPDQMSAKQLLELIDDNNKSATKKKKKKDKHVKELPDVRGDEKDLKEKKKAKKKKKQGSWLPEGKSKLRKKELSGSEASDSESRSLSPPSPISRDKKTKKHSKLHEVEVSQSLEARQMSGRKRSRNTSPERKSRSKTRKADLIRKKDSDASTISSTEDEKLCSKEFEKGEGNDKGSVERSVKTKTKQKADKKRIKQETEESSSSSSPSPEKQKKSKREVKKEKKTVKEEGKGKMRKAKNKKDSGRSRSSSSLSEDSSASLSQSPIRKKTKHVKQSKKKLKKFNKKSKKKNESASDSSSASELGGKEVSPPRKVHKKNKKKKNKQKKREMSLSSSCSSVLSSESLEKDGSDKDWGQKRKQKEKTKETEDGSIRSGSESPVQVRVQKLPNEDNKKSKKSDHSPAKCEKSRRRSSRSTTSESSLQAKIQKHPKDEKTKAKKSDHSPTKSEKSRRRSKSATAGKQDVLQDNTNDYDMNEIKIGVKRSKSSDTYALIHQDPWEEKSSKGAVSPSSTTDSHKKSKSFSKSSDDSEPEQSGHRKDEPKKQMQIDSPYEDRSWSTRRNKKGSSKSGEVDKDLDKKRSKMRTRSNSPLDSDDRSISKERRTSGQKDVKKSRETRSPRSKSPSPVKQQEATKSKKGNQSKQDLKREEEPEEKTSKVSRRSKSKSPRGRREESKEHGTPVRDRKRKRSQSLRTGSKSPENTRHDRRSRDGEDVEEETRRTKESGGRKDYSRRSVSMEKGIKRSQSADSTSVQSPRERKRSDNKFTPSPVGDEGNRRRSREEKDVTKSSRSTRSTSADHQDRKQRSKSGSYERDRDDKTGGGQRNAEKSQSKDRERSRSQDRDARKQERRRSSERDRHRSSERNRGISEERDRRRTGDDRKRDAEYDSRKRKSLDGKVDDRDHGRSDKDRETQRPDLEKPSSERLREQDRKDVKRRDDQSKDRDEKSKERDSCRRASGDKESNKREKIAERDSKYNDKEIEKNNAGGKDKVKSQDKEHNSKDTSTLNIKDIPMPPEDVKPEIKKDPSPIRYVTSGSCKDEIIKVKSKWDTDSEDDDDGTHGPSQNRRWGGGAGGRGGGSGTFTSQGSQSQPSQYSGGYSGSSGQSSGGYRRHSDLQPDESEFPLISDRGQSPDSILCFTGICHSNRGHAPLRLRGGCAASPPKLDDDQYTDSEVSFSASDASDFEGHNQKEVVRRRGHHRTSSTSSSSDSSSAERSKKRFKHSSESRDSSRRQSIDSTTSPRRESSSDSDGSVSSQSSSRSSRKFTDSDGSRLRSSSGSNSSSGSSSSGSRDSSIESIKRQEKENSDSQSSDSGDAGAYMLWDNWDDYMDSKGHQIGKTLASSTLDEDKPIFKKERADVPDTRNERPAVDTSWKQHGEVKEKGALGSDRVKTEKCSDSKSDESNQQGTIHGKRSRKLDDMSLRKDDRGEKRRQRDNSPEDGRCTSTSTVPVDVHRRQPEYSGYSNERRSPGRRMAHEREYQDRRNPFSDDYRNRPGQRPEREHYHQRRNPDRDHHHFRDDYQRQPFYQMDRNSFESHGRHFSDHRRHFGSQRGGRREQFWKRDDDWGRGVTEVKESAIFFGLVSSSKDVLIAQLYDASSNFFESVQLVCPKHRQWWC